MHRVALNVPAWLPKLNPVDGAAPVLAPPNKEVLDAALSFPMVPLPAGFPKENPDCVAPAVAWLPKTFGVLEAGVVEDAPEPKILDPPDGVAPNSGFAAGVVEPALASFEALPNSDDPEPPVVFAPLPKIEGLGVLLPPPWPKVKLMVREEADCCNR